MAVESSKNKSGPFMVAGTSGTFPRDFLIRDAAHVRVIRVRDGIEADLTEGISQTGIGSANGTVTVSTGIVAGDKVYLLRAVPNVQGSDYNAQGRVSPEQIESDLDLMQMQMQDVAERLGRTLVLTVSTEMNGEDALKAALEAPAYALIAKGAATQAGIYADQAGAVAAATAGAVVNAALSDPARDAILRGIDLRGSGAATPPIRVSSGEYYTNEDGGWVPRVPTTGLMNVENGQMMIWPDLQGDGDYDADLYFNSNGYFVFGARAHFNLGWTPGKTLGRIVMGCLEKPAGTPNVCMIQSWLAWGGTESNSLSIGPKNSTAWWAFFDAAQGGFLGLGTDAPSARLHVKDTQGTNAVIESTGNTTAGLSFRGTSQTSNTVAGVGINADGNLYLRADSAIQAFVSDNGISPNSDNNRALGLAANRWSVVYAGTGSINTSDERAKQDVGGIPDEWLDAWADVDWQRYRFIDRVDEKGEAARWHVGVVAQRVRDAFAARGLDAREIGLLCYDAWPDHYEPVWSSRKVMRMVTEERERCVPGEINPANGQPWSVRETYSVEVEREVDEPYDTGERRLVRAAGDQWGVRYDEAFAMEAALMRREISRLKAAGK